MISLEDISLTNWVLIGSTITALYKYITYNEGEDKLELDLNLKMIDTRLLEIKLKIENKGKVRAKILMQNLTYKVVKHDSLDTFSKNNCEYNSDTEKKRKENTIAKCPFINDNDYSWINGGTIQYYTEYVKLPQEIQYVECIVKLIYQDKDKDWHSCRKVIKIDKVV